MELNKMFYLMSPSLVIFLLVPRVSLFGIGGGGSYRSFGTLYEEGIYLCTFINH